MRDALERLVSSESDMEIVGQAADGQPAIELARMLKPLAGLSARAFSL
jgi:DNA-binding NarL/FixJ family response regulator